MMKIICCIWGLSVLSVRVRRKLCVGDKNETSSTRDWGSRAMDVFLLGALCFFSPILLFVVAVVFFYFYGSA